MNFTTIIMLIFTAILAIGLVLKGLIDLSTLLSIKNMLWILHII